MLGDTNAIAKRLNERDNKNYNVDTLNSMQVEERLHGGFIAKTLDIPYLELSNLENTILEYTILNL